MGNPFTYGSVCSGIEAASVAWEQLGWKPAFFSEIEPFPCAALAHHYPNTPNLGDMTQHADWKNYAINLLVGGTPCQAFSVAGLRKGMDDPRGNLTLTFLAIVAQYRPRWVVWENVPGVLSSVTHAAPDPCPPPDPLDMECDGQEVDADDEYDSEELHAFNCFLAGLAELGYGVAYRILDAQYAGLAQRRRRVFVVGCLGDWAGAAAVFLERHSLSGHPAPSRKAGKGTAPTLSARTKGGGGLGTNFDLDGGLIADPVTPPLTRNPYGDHESREGLLICAGTGQAGTGQAGTGQAGTEILANLAPTLNCNHEAPYIAHSLRGEGFDASEDGSGRGTPLVVGSLSASAGKRGYSADEAAAGHYIAFQGQGTTLSHDEDITGTLRQGCGNPSISAPCIAFSCKDHSADAGEISPTLRSMNHDGSHANGGGQIAVAFDTTQITSAANRSNPQPGDPCHPLAAGAHPPAVAFAQNQIGEIRESDVFNTLNTNSNASGRNTPLIAFPERMSGTQCAATEDLSPALAALNPTAIAFSGRARGDDGRGYERPPLVTNDIVGTLDTVKPWNVSLGPTSAVRRLTPRECERLQGFPDDYTLIPYNGKLAADGPRYKALGNSMAVPVMRWIGERIQRLEVIFAEQSSAPTTHSAKPEIPDSN